MDLQAAKTASASPTLSPFAILIFLAVLLACAFAALAALSFRFQPDSEIAERPILLTFGLLGLAFIVYLMALRVVLKVSEGRPLLVVILLSSVLLRGVSLFSWPIQEVDIYRYIWDGAAVLQGVNPYRYSPQQVLADRTERQLPKDMRRLVDLRDSSFTLKTILSRVHYSELPTIYPPVSQFVFASAVLITPAHVGVFEHVLVMKSVLVLFDIATLVIVLGLLRLTSKHIGWSVAYGWCPLVIKEIANTGHLDSVAVFLSMLALYFAVKPLVNRSQERVREGAEVGSARHQPSRQGTRCARVSGPRIGPDRRSAESRRPLVGGFGEVRRPSPSASPSRTRATMQISGQALSRVQAVTAAVLLALAVGAKLYPIVLAPMFVLLWSRVQGWRWASFAMLAFLAATRVSMQVREQVAFQDTRGLTAPARLARQSERGLNRSPL